MIKLPICVVALATFASACQSPTPNQDVFSLPQTHQCPQGQQVSSHGGTVFRHPVVNVIFWGEWDRQVSNQYVSAIQSMSTYMGSRLSEYGVEGFTLGYVAYQGNITNPISLLSPNLAVNLMLYPPGYYPSEMANCGCDGYHNWFTSFVVADVTYHDNINDGTYVISHELWESFTDPQSNTYYDNNNGGEVADLCDSEPAIILPDGTHIESAWSQEQCRCQ